MDARILQPHRKDLLINTDWGIPKEELSKEEAGLRGLRTYKGRYVTREEKKKLKDELHAYRTIRLLSFTFVFLAFYSFLLFKYPIEPDSPRRIYQLICSISFLFGGIGISWYKNWGRIIVTPVLLSLLYLPFVHEIATDKGAPIIGFFGVISLYWLYRKTARRIFKKTKTIKEPEV